jgi:hypothetical protein
MNIRMAPSLRSALLVGLVAVATCAVAQVPVTTPGPGVLQQLSAPELPPKPVISSRAPYAPEALVPDDTAAPRSVVFDKPKGRALADEQAPLLLTRIDVVGTPDPPPVKAKSFQQRFSDALAGRPNALSKYMYSNSTEPCTSLASPGTPFTESFNVNGFCP